MKLCKTINQKNLVTSLVVQMNPTLDVKKQDGYETFKGEWQLQISLIHYIKKKKKQQSECQTMIIH